MFTWTILRQKFHFGWPMHSSRLYTHYNLDIFPLPVAGSRRHVCSSIPRWPSFRVRSRNQVDVVGKSFVRPDSRPGEPAPVLLPNNLLFTAARSRGHHIRFAAHCTPLCTVVEPTFGRYSTLDCVAVFCNERASYCVCLAIIINCLYTVTSVLFSSVYAKGGRGWGESQQY
jgi:hypothetical protein